MLDKINQIDRDVLNQISNIENITKGAYNIRKNGKGIDKKVTKNISIDSKTDVSGIDIRVKEGTKGEFLHIPVIVSESGLKDKVYNDFFIGENSDVTIVAGCGIHNCNNEDSAHDGIHRFYVGKNSKVLYIEKHYAEGNGKGKKILNPVTEVYLEEGSSLEMQTTQIRGVDYSIRETKGEMGKNTNLVIKEKILTDENQYAKTIFDFALNGENSSAQLISRAVATGNSKQEFISKIYGNEKSFAHSECDAIIKDNAKVLAAPEITANHVDANLIHEAAIGKIAGEQLMKLMTLGLNEKEAEEEIIKGFLK